MPTPTNNNAAHLNPGPNNAQLTGNPPSIHKPKVPASKKITKIRKMTCGLIHIVKQITDSFNQSLVKGLTSM